MEALVLSLQERGFFCFYYLEKENNKFEFVESKTEDLFPS